MEEIKFRIWNGKAMEYGGFSIHATGKVLIGDLSSAKEDSPVMQFTGIKDKNHKEIYKEDILQLDWGVIKLIGYVKQQDDGEWIFYKDSKNYLGVYHNKDKVEIIGHVYEGG